MSITRNFEGSCLSRPIVCFWENTRIRKRIGWENLPNENVVFVYLFYFDGKSRCVRLVGYDNYFCELREDGILELGGWVDVNQPWSTPERLGQLIRIYGNGNCESEPLLQIPDFKITKRGVMVPEPYAIQLGLTSNMKTGCGCG